MEGGCRREGHLVRKGGVHDLKLSAMNAGNRLNRGRLGYADRMWLRED